MGGVHLTTRPSWFYRMECSILLPESYIVLHGRICNKKMKTAELPMSTIRDRGAIPVVVFVSTSKASGAQSDIGSEQPLLAKDKYMEDSSRHKERTDDSPLVPDGLNLSVFQVRLNPSTSTTSNHIQLDFRRIDVSVFFLVAAETLEILRLRLSEMDGLRLFTVLSLSLPARKVGSA